MYTRRTYLNKAITEKNKLLKHIVTLRNVAPNLTNKKSQITESNCKQRQFTFNYLNEESKQ